MPHVTFAIARPVDDAVVDVGGAVIVPLDAKNGDARTAVPKASRARALDRPDIVSTVTNVWRKRTTQKRQK